MHRRNIYGNSADTAINREHSYDMHRRIIYGNSADTACYETYQVKQASA